MSSKAAFHLLYLIKVVLDVHVRVEQLRSVRTQVHPVQDQVLEGLLQVCIADQHSAHHPASAEDHLHKKQQSPALKP